MLRMEKGIWEEWLVDEVKWGEFFWAQKIAIDILKTRIFARMDHNKYTEVYVNE